MAFSLENRSVFHRGECILPGIVMFGRYRHAASRSGLPPHSHRDAIEICFLERGEQTYRVGKRIYRLRGNDQFFTFPGEIHDTAGLPQERGILYWLILRLDKSNPLLGLSPTQSRRLRQELLHMPERHFRGHPNCADILAEIHTLMSEKAAARRKKRPGQTELRLQSLLLHYLTLTIEASHRGVKGSASPLMQRVLQFIERHLEDPIHVPRLAEVARISESRLKTRFKREIGVPPAEFWLRQKIEKAAILLKTQNVTRVAHALGFSSSQYFATAFKRYTLANPRDFMPAQHRAGVDKPAISS